MKPFLKLFLCFSLSLWIMTETAVAGETCVLTDYTLQLLGSGGPISDDKRSSSGALIWWHNQPQILIDAGGGVFLRFGQSGAHLEDVELIALTHFHTDHVSDLPALLKNSYFFDQEKTIKITGPTAGAHFPSLSHFLTELFNGVDGAYAYLSGLYDATDGIRLKIEPLDIDYKNTQPVKVYEKNGLVVSALGIPHGDVPTLAYRIDSPNGRIVFSSDQNGSNPAFIDFAQQADILVMPAAITEDADEMSSFMHAKPSIVGKIAEKTHPEMLVLDHFMGKSLRDKDQIMRIIKQYYHGPIKAGRDLACYPVVIKKENHEK